MTRLSASLGSVVFFLVAPAMIAGVVPWWMTRWQVKLSSFLDVLALKIIGVILIGSGLVVLLDSFARFALQGIGTPAPAFPTRHLVVTGLYRYVRNPIYLAVTALILGQGLLFASVGLIAYGALIWVGFHVFVIAYEGADPAQNIRRGIRRLLRRCPALAAADPAVVVTRGRVRGSHPQGH